MSNKPMTPLPDHIKQWIDEAKVKCTPYESCQDDFEQGATEMYHYLQSQHNQEVQRYEKEMEELDKFIVWVGSRIYYYNGSYWTVPGNGSIHYTTSELLQLFREQQLKQ